MSIDPALLLAADIREFEQVHVVDINNGASFETCAVPGGAGEICLNGPAARLVQPGDLVIIFTYGDYADEELAGFEPTVVHVDDKNHLLQP